MAGGTGGAFRKLTALCLLEMLHCSLLTRRGIVVGSERVGVEGTIDVCELLLRPDMRLAGLVKGIS